MGRTLEQILATEKPEVVAKANAMAEEVLLNIHLAELRERVKKTQVEIAQQLNIKQPTVAGMEKPGRDLKLSTLKRYVEAAGGKLRLNIELPDGSHYEFVVYFLSMTFYTRKTVRSGALFRVLARRLTSPPCFTTHKKPSHHVTFCIHGKYKGNTIK